MLPKTYASTILASLLLQKSYATSPSCRDQSNNLVDWWMMYKMPVLVGNEDEQYAAGYGYAYMDSNTLKLEVQTGSYLTDDNIALTYTLDQIYSASTTGDVGWVMYNDEKPDGSSSSYRGHTKGAAAFDADGGFFLDHSVPRWPPVQSDTYIYPDYETTNGQSFLCISVDSKNMDTIIKQWEYTYPNWYDSYNPSSLDDVYTNLTTILNGYHVKVEPWDNTEVVKTLKSHSFTYLAKYSNWGLDFYEDLVAPTLGVDLLTETWQEGSGNLPSFCSEADGGDYDWTVLNIKGIDLGDDISFTETKDHSKWAISKDKADPWVCIGDINRQSGQESRAGGTLCIEMTSVWNAYNKTITTVMPC